MKKKRKIFLASLIGAAVLGISVYAGYNTYGVYQQTEENFLLLENVEALAQSGESTTTISYIVHHSKCFKNGIETGEFHAWCYEAPNGPSPTCHKHSCSNCSSY